MTSPTETPPGEGSTGMALSEHANDANSGPVSPNRTPMIVTLAALGVLLALVLAAVVAAVASLAR
ncbi:MAG: hypothetical protein QOE45_1867 [Frankiaceae bacterium]|jgi:hypothetical protein|nr:hypothetical protein [Frankiaceae bacterium]